MFVMVLSQECLECFGNGKLTDSIIRRTVTYDRSGQLLQGEGLPPQDGKEQHGFEKHATEWIFVIVQQASYRSGSMDARIVTIETELVPGLFDSGV